MDKLVVTVLTIMFSGVAFASDSMIGRWDCKMVSEYGDFEFELTLNEDGTYTNTTDIFGNISVDSGNWSVEGDELIMHRTKTNKNGEENASDFQFRRDVTSVSDTTLGLKHDEVVTTCTRL